MYNGALSLIVTQEHAYLSDFNCPFNANVSVSQVNKKHLRSLFSGIIHIPWNKYHNANRLHCAALGGAAADLSPVAVRIVCVRCLHIHGTTSERVHKRWKSPHTNEKNLLNQSERQRILCIAVQRCSCECVRVCVYGAGMCEFGKLISISLV